MITAAMVCLLLLPMLVGCGSTSPPTRAAERPRDAGVIRVKNAGRTLRFSSPPQRVVTLNQSATELFLALGLEDRMVGTAYRDNPIPDRFRSAYESIPELARQYPSLEVLLSVDPDFVYGFKSAFQPPKGPATIQRLDQLGITPYVDRMFYDRGLTIEDVHTEIRKLGRIFRISARARQLVQRLRVRVEDSVRCSRGRRRHFEVAVYDSGRQTMYTAGRSILSDLIRKLGGTNVFADRFDKSWARVSWEALIRENPDWIVVMDYGHRTARQKMNYLRSRESLAGLKAVREKRFVVVPLTETFIGVRHPRALERMARAFYPEVCGRS